MSFSIIKKSLQNFILKQKVLQTDESKVHNSWKMRHETARYNFKQELVNIKRASKLQ